MKLLILLTLLASCSLKPMKKKGCNCSKKSTSLTRASKLHICMKDFANQGFDSDAIVKICSKVHETRK